MSNKLGGGLGNQMRALGYSIRNPRDPEDCSALEVHCPDGVTVLLAATEAEGWERASEHWHSTQLGKIAIKPAAMSDVVVTDADQEAAAEIVRLSTPFDTYGQLLQGLARHRIAARKQALEEAAEVVLSSLACSICGEINDCQCDFDIAVSAGPCQPSTDRLADAIHKLGETK